jgi:hypothetical protein
LLQLSVLDCHFLRCFPVYEFVCHHAAASRTVSLCVFNSMQSTGGAGGGGGAAQCGALARFGRQPAAAARYSLSLSIVGFVHAVSSCMHLLHWLSSLVVHWLSRL